MNEKIGTIVDTTYYDIRKRLSKFKKYRLMFLMGDRNVGKTTSVYRYLFNLKMSDYLRTKEQPKQIGIIIRNSKNWDRVKKSFLDNIRSLLNFDFLIEGMNIIAVAFQNQTNKDGTVKIKKRKLFTLAQIFILWNANDYKSGNYEYIDYLVFDEIVPEDDATYIPSEINRFESLFSTIDRSQGRVKVIGICNRVSNDSIYFTNYLGIGPDNFPQVGETVLLPNRLALLEYATQSDFIREKVNKSRSNQIFKDSAYQKMATGEGLLKNENYMIKTKLNCPWKVLYNIAIDDNIYIVCEFAKYHKWIFEGKSEEHKTYCLNYQAAIKNGQASNWVCPDNLIYEFRRKISLGSLWFKDTLTRDLLIDWLKKMQRV